MRSKLLLTCAIGAWLAGTPFMWMTAIKNFETVDNILAAQPSGFEFVTEPLSDDDLREAMRYQASEVNRLFFDGWGWTQLAIGLVAAVLAWRSGSGKVVLGCVVAALGIAIYLQLVAVPGTIRLGRLIDFGRGGVEETAAFLRYHHTYTGLDMAKFVLLLLATGVVALRRQT